MITIKKYNSLSDQIKNELNSYINNEFGHLPMINETEWATPDWTIINSSGNSIAMFYNIVERYIIIDGIKHKAAGIGNVITLNEFRGGGFASETLSETENFIFDDLKCELGVLLCDDKLIPFYSRLNWYKVNCSLYFGQSSGRKAWKANTMLRSRQEKWDPKEIDLNGLPW